jgi:hypothetical protein
MNIYGKYLPLIARFSMELADEKRMPRYRKLIGEGPREAATKPESEPQPAPEVPAEGVSKEIEQKKIDEFS